ncbi:MAG: hypothetical protein LLG20_00650, partial [Acidobacteriales bacterium]|nr:hypothetical protein [Terriglobales bacterium]
LKSTRWPWATSPIAYAVDYRDVGSYAPWYLDIDVGDGMDTGSLRWNSKAIPYEHAMYLQEVNSSGVPTGVDIDMATQESLTITADCKYRIHLGEATENYNVTIKPGWNLVSLPLYPTTPDPDVVFSDSDIDYVQEWNPTTAAFVDAGVILPKMGYWIHSNQETNISVTATGWRPPDYVTRYLQGPATGATVYTREAIGFCAAMANMFPACTKAYLQQFNATTGAYENVLAAVEGVGYWIDVTADGQIVVKPR